MKQEIMTKSPEYTSAEKALSLLKSGQNVFIHSVAAAPRVLIEAMVQRAAELRNVKIFHLHTEGEAPYTNPEYEGVFHHNAFFIGKNVRKAIAEGRGSYIPVFLSEIPRLIRQRIVPIHVVLVSVSPPDKHGFCSLGTSVDATRAAIDGAEVVIAQVNSYVPRTHRYAQIHHSRLSCIVEYNTPLYTHEAGAISSVEEMIGRNVASLVEDGATLQLGIGNIPNAVLASLSDHKDLGIHTEMFSDGVIP